MQTPPGAVSAVPTAVLRVAGRSLGTTIPALAFLVMTYVSWRRWPDLLVDVGDEFYTAWQLSEGQPIGVDLVYGPLSVYLNSLVFRLFGPEYLSLSLFNLALAALLCCLIFRFFLVVGDTLSASFSTTAFILLFAFPNYFIWGNYNFINPYTHAVTHGVVLSFVSLICLQLYLSKSQERWLWAIGVSSGLVFLTKPETFVSLVAGLTLVLAVDAIRSGSEFARLAQSGLIFVTAMIAPVAIFFFAIMIDSSAPHAARVVFAGWATIADFVTHSWMSTEPSIGPPLVVGLLGTDRPLENLQTMAVQLFKYGMTFACALLLNRTLAKLHGSTPLAAVTCFAITLILLVSLPTPFPLTWSSDAAAGLPVVALVCVGWLSIRSLRIHEAREQGTKSLATLALAVFSLGMMGRMFLNTTLFHYGFALALPGTLLFAHLLLDLGARVAERKGARAVIYRAFILAVLIAFCVPYVRLTFSNYARRNTLVASTFRSPDRKFDPKTPVIVDTLNWIEQELPSDATFTAFPEGAMMNFLTKRSNPVPITSFNPMTFNRIGESQVIRWLESNAPDYVLLVHRNNSEHGARFFGRDFAIATASWITAHYTPLKQFGHTPFRHGGFGILILERRS